MRKWTLLSLLLLMGCGGGGTSTPFSIVGKWDLVKIADASGTGDCPIHLTSGRNCTANTVLWFQADGTYRNAGGTVLGTYSLNGNTLTLTDSSGPQDCPIEHVGSDKLTITERPGPDYLSLYLVKE